MRTFLESENILAGPRNKGLFEGQDSFKVEDRIVFRARSGSCVCVLGWWCRWLLGQLFLVKESNFPTLFSKRHICFKMHFSFAFTPLAIQGNHMTSTTWTQKPHLSLQCVISLRRSVLLLYDLWQFHFWHQFCSPELQNYGTLSLFSEEQSKVILGKHRWWDFRHATTVPRLL